MDYFVPKAVRKYLSFSPDDLNKFLDLTLYEKIKTHNEQLYQITYFKHKKKSIYLKETKSFGLERSQTNYKFYENEAFSYVSIGDKRNLHNNIFKIISTTDVTTNKPIALEITFLNEGGPLYLLYSLGQTARIECNHKKINYTLIVSNINSLLVEKTYQDKIITKNYEDNILFQMNIKNSQTKEQKIIYKHSDKSNKYTYVNFERNFIQHRLNGPSSFRICNKIKEQKLWYVNGKKIPDNIIHYEKNLTQPITKPNILDAMLFDLEYGEFLKEKS